MLKCASAYTYEIDNLEVALKEIKSQLDGKITLLGQTIGVVTCHTEFISNGTMKYICDNLPFNIVGMTTAAQAVDGESGELVLTIFVMTSDDIRFEAGVTGCLEENLEEPIKTAIGGTIAGHSGPPGLALVFPPLIFKYSGDSFVEILQKLLPSVPIFGAIAVDDSTTYEWSETIYNGANYKTSMSYVLCYGNISPRFIVGTFPEDSTMPYRGEVTKSSGSLVYEINNMNAYQYFESIGFIEQGVLADNFKLVPFAIDQKKRPDYDGVPVVRGIGLFLEDGTALFRGDVDEGSVFSMLSSGAGCVLSATREKLEQLNELAGVNGVLLFPCVGRHIMTTGNTPLIELETARETIRPGIPFMMSYAGGEICPTLVKDGVPSNRYHNYSLVILVV